MNDVGGTDEQPMSDNRGMTDPPTADDLLATAREALQDELLPQLPASAHYTARMIANAIAMARREMVAPPLEARLRDELMDLAGVALADHGAGASGAPAWPERLCARIRSGAFDADRQLQRRLVRALRESTRVRLAITNPRLLQESAT